MKIFSRLTCLIVLGVCLTTSLPIVAAILIARSQAIEREQIHAIEIARTALRRAEMTGDQLGEISRTINSLTLSQACSVEGLDLMRSLDLRSTLLQAVGRMDGNTMRCSSLGQDRSFDLGPADWTSATNTQFRQNVALIDNDHPYVAVQSGNAVGIVHRDLALSFVEEMPGLDVEVFSWSQRRSILKRGRLGSEMVSSDTRPESVFRVDNRQVALVRSDRFDLGAIAVLPLGSTENYAVEAALLLVPPGGLIGLILSAVLVHVLRTRASLPMLIRAGLKRKRFYLLYQPVVDLQTEEIIGVEALMRWDRGQAETISPDHFIAVAEEHGLIHLITGRMLDLLADDAKLMLRVAPDFHFAVNFSMQDMQRAEIMQEIENLIVRSGIGYENLVVEATERSLIDINLARETISRMRAIGIKVAIDDFGTGYSSLGYLAQLEIDFLKIDKLFVQSLGTAAATSQVAARIIDMAKDLKLRIVAEGIETEDQARILRNLDVGLAQGYLYGRPMPVDDLLQILRTQRTRRNDCPLLRVA